MHHLHITEVIGRANQGATRPFICRANDGHIYYVKGKSASAGERIREWIGANLASAFGLLVPEMALLEIPRSLLAINDSETQNDLGAGYAVGSQQITATDELRIEDIPAIPLELQQSVLILDFWLRNEDRTLSEFGGNPNLLLQQKTGKLYAIDYNLILPAAMDNDLFWSTHVFRESLQPDNMDAGIKQLLEQKMQKALTVWTEALQQLPETWLEENETTRAFDFKNVLKLLKDESNGALWRRMKT